MDAYPENDPKERLQIVHEGVFSPNSRPIAINALVPVLPLAPDGRSRCSLMARSKSIRKADQDGFSSSSLRIRLPVEISPCKNPALVCNVDQAAPEPYDRGL
ncbi:hypothetical protein V6Z88_003728 [Aspergillus fumigatus]